MDKCDELLARLDALQALADAEVPGTEDALFASVRDVFQEDFYVMLFLKKLEYVVMIVIGHLEKTLQVISDMTQFMV